MQQRTTITVSREFNLIRKNIAYVCNFCSVKDESNQIKLTFPRLRFYLWSRTWTAILGRWATTDRLLRPKPSCRSIPAPPTAPRTRGISPSFSRTRGGSAQSASPRRFQAPPRRRRTASMETPVPGQKKKIPRNLRQ